LDKTYVYVQKFGWFFSRIGIDLQWITDCMLDQKYMNGYIYVKTDRLQLLFT